MAKHLVNIEQEQAWNGDEGHRWTLSADRYEASTATHTAHLMTAADIGEHDRVLDVGCGCGRTTRQAARMAPQGTVLGVDLSQQMISWARDRAAEQNLRNVTFRRVDAQIHRFGSSVFDVVLSKYGAMFFADPVAAFTNLRTAVKTGGRLALLSWGDLHDNPWVDQIREALTAGRALPEPPRHAPGPFGLSDPDYAQRILDQSGWTETNITRINEPVRLGEDSEDAFAFVSNTGAAIGMLDGLTPTARERSLQRMREVLDAAMTGDGVFLPSQSWLIEARG